MSVDPSGAWPPQAQISIRPEVVDTYSWFGDTWNFLACAAAIAESCRVPEFLDIAMSNYRSISDQLRNKILEGQLRSGNPGYMARNLAEIQPLVARWQAAVTEIRDQFNTADLMSRPVREEFANAIAAMTQYVSDFRMMSGNPEMHRAGDRPNSMQDALSILNMYRGYNAPTLENGIPFGYDQARHFEIHRRLFNMFTLFWGTDNSNLDQSVNVCRADALLQSLQRAMRAYALLYRRIYAEVEVMPA
jgi:hypothetical protein